MITDAALDPYTTTGHDGVLVPQAAMWTMMPPWKSSPRCGGQADAGVDWMPMGDGRPCGRFVQH